MSASIGKSSTDLPIYRQEEGAVLRLQVLCLCAQWCGVCRDYHQAFDAFSALRPSISTQWIDIEDEGVFLEDV